MLTTSTPTALKASNTDGGARKVKDLSSALPRSVTAVSRLTIVRSAAFSRGATGASAVRGCRKRSVSRPAVCTSPAKLNVTGPRGGGLVIEAGADVWDGAVLVVGSPASPGPSGAEHPATARAAMRHRRRHATRRTIAGRAARPHPVPIDSSVIRAAVRWRPALRRGLPDRPHGGAAALPRLNAMKTGASPRIMLAVRAGKGVGEFGGPVAAVIES